MRAGGGVHIYSRLSHWQPYLALEKKRAAPLPMLPASIAAVVGDVLEVTGGPTPGAALLC